LDASGGGSSTAQSLIMTGIRAIMVCTPMSHRAEDKFVEHEVPVLYYDHFRIKWIGKNPCAEAEEINRAIKETRKLFGKRRKLSTESYLLKFNDS